MNLNEWRIQPVSWGDNSESLRNIRDEVFVQEQNVPLDLEWDDFDNDAMHFLVLDSEDKPVGCTRLLPDGQIGRVAVLKRLRGKGIGHELMRFVIEYALKHDYPDLFLHSQLSAQAFYKSLGFVEYGDVYDEAGIDHISMKLEG